MSCHGYRIQGPFGSCFKMPQPPFTLFQKCIHVKPPKTKPSLSVHCTQYMILMSSPIIQEAYCTTQSVPSARVGCRAGQGRCLYRLQAYYSFIYTCNGSRGKLQRGSIGPKKPQFALLHFFGTLCSSSKQMCIVAQMNS